MGFRQETLRHKPAYRQTHEGGLPSLPNRPRTPHVPHARALVMGVALTLAGTAAAASLERASQTLAQTQTDPRTNLVPAELMRYPWDSGNVHLDLDLRKAGDGFVFDGATFTTEPEVFKIDQDSHVVYVLGQEYGEPENFFGHIEITLLNDVMKGGIWEKSVDVNGNTILNVEGKPILQQFSGSAEPAQNQEAQPVIA